MTSDQAKKLRCCGPEGCGRITYERVQAEEDVYRVAMVRFCIADECMAWRWEGRSASTGFCGLVK